ncbi:MAG: efflux RND transporter periplasmic adaptor subunit [Verrucomicrobiota bacterium]
MQQSDSLPGAQKPPTAPAAKPTGPTPSYESASGQSGGFMWIIILLFVIGGIGFIVWRAKQTAAAAAAGAKRSDPAVPVTPGTVKEEEVAIYCDGLGTVQAYNAVTVNTRVDGQVIKIAFTEGQDVHTNDLLAQIDPGPFQAALDAAKARKLQDIAQLDNAKLDLQRDFALTNIVSGQALDTQSNLVRQLQAMVTNDEAGIESCQVQLDYTTIRSTLDGRCGIRMVDQGNILRANDTNGIVVITQLRPIYVSFILPEQDAGRIARKMAEGPVTVLALDRDNKTVLDTGILSVIDNQIDSTTGTIKLKATFPNQNLTLWPGQFVNPRVLVDKVTSLVVAESVIQRGPDGAYVYTIEEKGTNLVAKLTPVTVALQQGDLALIAKGLTAGQTVVADGQYRLENGSKISTNAPAAAPGSPGLGNRRGNGSGTNHAPEGQPPKPTGA